MLLIPNRQLVLHGTLREAGLTFDEPDEMVARDLLQREVCRHGDPPKVQYEVINGVCLDYRREGGVLVTRKDQEFFIPFRETYEVKRERDGVLITIDGEPHTFIQYCAGG